MVSWFCSHPHMSVRGWELQRVSHRFASHRFSHPCKGTRGCNWRTQSVEGATLELGVMSLSPTFGVETTLKINKIFKSRRDPRENDFHPQHQRYLFSYIFMYMHYLDQIYHSFLCYSMPYVKSKEKYSFLKFK